MTAPCALRFIPTYRDDAANTVAFVPISGAPVPGFTHRVVLNGIAVGYLAEAFRPSAKSAAFFLDKADSTLRRGACNGSV